MIKRLLKISEYFFGNNVLGVIDIGDIYIYMSVYNRKNKQSYEFIDIFKIEAIGFENSLVVDITKAIDTFAKLLNTAETSIKRRIIDVIVNSPYSKTKISTYNYSSNIKSVISAVHIEQILDIESYENSLNSDEFMISLVKSDVLVDGKIIENPIGLYAKNITSTVSCISVFKPFVINLLQILDYFSLKLHALVYSTVSLPQLFCNMNKRNIFLLDIGLKDTNIAIIKNSKVLYTTVLNIGMNDILNKLSEKFSISTTLILQQDLLNNTMMENKFLEITVNGIKSSLLYSEFSKYFYECIKDFLKEVSVLAPKNKIIGIDSIEVVGEFASLIIANTQGPENVKLIEEQIKSQYGNKNLHIEDLKTLSLFNYYYNNYNNDEALKTFNSRVQHVL